VAADSSLRFLFHGRGFLEEKANPPLRIRADYAVVGGKLGCHKASQSGDAFSVKPDSLVIERQKHIAGRDNDLPLPRHTGREAKIGWEKAVEESHAQGAVGFSRDGDKNLAAGPVSGNPA
jgi:hypothetical protein